jgi:hypothetical protein
MIEIAAGDDDGFVDGLVALGEPPFRVVSVVKDSVDI